MATVEAAMIGAGQRGHHVYGPIALRESGALQFVAVVDPRQDRRNRFGDAHQIPADRRLADHRDLLASAVDPPAWFVAGPDRTHAATAIDALEAGHHVLLEKPIAATARDAVAVADAGAEAEGVLVVAHVLRHTAFYRAVREVLGGGRLGRVITVAMRENVVAWHMAHSFVRGNWARSSDSSPMIVQKCCHDLDLIGWLLGDRVRKLWSVGSLIHFRPDEAPQGATKRCTDGCRVAACPFDARSVYLDARLVGWPVHVITDDLSPTGRQQALADGPYGRCVYTAGSDVVDHQVVAMEMESGASATLTMHGHAPREERTIRIDGTLASLRGVFGARAHLEVLDHETGDVEQVDLDDGGGGHGGGDGGVVHAFLAAVRGGHRSGSDLREVLEGHLLAFAAEESRIGGLPIEMSHFRQAWR